MDDNETLKQCCDCNSILPTSLFNLNDKKIDGLQRYCVWCEGVRLRLYEDIKASGNINSILD